MGCHQGAIEEITLIASVPHTAPKGEGETQPETQHRSLWEILTS